MSSTIPPCVRKAVIARDQDALDEIFSYLRSFGDDKDVDSLLWSVGYYDFANYQQKRLTAKAQIRSAPFFICSIVEKPQHLSKYCTKEDEANCPLKDGVTKFDMLIKDVFLYHEPGRPYATLEVVLKDGTVFRRINGTYGLLDASSFWEATTERFINWYMETHKGKYPDVFIVDKDAVKKLLYRRAHRLEVGWDGSTTMHKIDGAKL